jgi:tRNA pseudouridine synthase 10
MKPDDSYGSAGTENAATSGDVLGADYVETEYVKENLKWELRQSLNTSLSPLRWNHESPLMICLSLDHKSSLSDCIGVKKLRPKLFPRPKKQRWKKYQPTPFSKLPIEKALEDLTDADMVKQGYFLSLVTIPCSHKIEIQHKSVFVAGRYNKYSRTLPQTPWVIDGVRKVDTSVQELICPQILQAFRASDVKFSSSGREDVDVLMLGNGRPFLLELLNPMDVSISNAKLQKIEDAINTETKMVAVHHLKRVGKESSTLLKEGEEEKKKIYSALVWTEAEITQEKLKLLDETTNLILKQKTPIRVLHRRTLAVREKVIYSMKTQLLDPHHFRFHLVTQAGTYIKEFVHGDFGRTQPNVGMLLGCDADILSLDVLEVQLEWPPIAQLC